MGPRGGRHRGAQLASHPGAPRVMGSPRAPRASGSHAWERADYRTPSHSNIDVLGLQVLTLGGACQQERQGLILGGHCMLMRDIQLLPLGFSGESLVPPTGGWGWMGDPCVRLPHRMTGKV